MPSSDLLACPVCFETFEDPQLLTSCGHTFCRRCVEEVWPRTCPVCRAPFGAQGFRPNFALRMVLGDPPARDTSGGAASVPEPSAPPLQALLGAQQATGSRLVRSVSGEQEADREGRVVPGLVEAGLPLGLARLVCEEDAQIALRIFLLDNSGSTSSHDGRVFDGGRMVDCSRWEETYGMALQQARWNAGVGTPCEFVLLNSPAGQRSQASGFQEGLDFIRIDPSLGGAEGQLELLEALLRRVQPSGQTPLVRRLNELYSRILRERDELLRAGQRVVLIIATDGQPTEPRGRLVEVLRRTALELPVHIVIRLTTNDADVVGFYNDLDEELEIPLEVLDDLEGEAKEIASKGNGWLTYSPMLHTLREQGTFVKLLDLIDERQLTATEATVLARLMLQGNTGNSIVPRNPEDFCSYVQERLQGLEPVYNPLTRRFGPILDVRALGWRLVPLSRRLADGLAAALRMFAMLLHSLLRALNLDAAAAGWKIR
mmetsp:Transcript_50789/g.157310  ORF Transcript_50789/g.157310 Transcript_50789/m.157310 type:complete len:487 (-) Transcript_50789:6-1466(-)|eukprot:CAMPEP_0204572522 /NCGR_PEP_ID=MMETSP0661-20131031/39513_1 /ASSEMBLY_ACC=CAM_ASM_000606 /TAXON_ID=109239 /ORGANISM="Alexandrium margalefi, Strain AMGDE01CS-322" /LENGTH=486 /DNA_ID=CAMNT_0051580883 /DNA_START=47 /DNA_END=1504 /DNA_ORIENTATION=-